MLEQLLAELAVMAYAGPRAAAADPLAHTFSIVARDSATGEPGALDMMRDGRPARR